MTSLASELRANTIRPYPETVSRVTHEGRVSRKLNFQTRSGSYIGAMSSLKAINDVILKKKMNNAYGVYSSPSRNKQHGHAGQWHRYCLTSTAGALRCHSRAGPRSSPTSDFRKSVFRARHFCTSEQRSLRILILWNPKGQGVSANLWKSCSLNVYCHSPASSRDIICFVTITVTDVIFCSRLLLTCMTQYDSGCVVVIKEWQLNQ